MVNQYEKNREEKNNCACGSGVMLGGMRNCFYNVSEVAPFGWDAFCWRLWASSPVQNV